MSSSSTSKSIFATYRELSKSGIVTLVLISVLGGYLIGHPLEKAMDPMHLLATLAGILFLASGSSALNQLQEWHIDAEMPRTSQRPIPSGRMSRAHALSFVLATLVLGLLLLYRADPQLLVLGLAAVATYNGFYTLWWKKAWAYAAVPGAVPGALPILMGHVAANGHVMSPGGIYLFALLFFWQMPHFWVLALRYRHDYELGGVPTLPVAYGSGVTVLQITLWCLAYVGLALIAPFFLGVGLLYIICAWLVGGKLLWELKNFIQSPESKSWLRFFLWVNFSLVIFIAAATIDLWGVYLWLPYLV